MKRRQWGSERVYLDSETSRHTIMFWCHATESILSIQKLRLKFAFFSTAVVACSCPRELKTWEFSIRCFRNFKVISSLFFFCINSKCISAYWLTADDGLWQNCRKFSLVVIYKYNECNVVGVSQTLCFMRAEYEQVKKDISEEMGVKNGKVRISF